MITEEQLEKLAEEGMSLVEAERFEAEAKEMEEFSKQLPSSMDWIG